MTTLSITDICVANAEFLGVESQTTENKKYPLLYIFEQHGAFSNAYAADELYFSLELVALIEDYMVTNLIEFQHDTWKHIKDPVLMQDFKIKVNPSNRFQVDWIKCSINKETSKCEAVNRAFFEAVVKGRE